MKLSISNIGWKAEQDESVYCLMKQYGFSGVEIAPTRIVPEKPFDRIPEIKTWSENLHRQYGFSVPSMQSIWYGRTERIFASEEERNALVDYTKCAIDLAHAIDCNNLVFGCPRNRVIAEDTDPRIAMSFFREIGEYAHECGTVIGMEANPPIYNTNYINDTLSALELIRQVNSKGFRLNLDIGTMVHNGESLDVLHNAVYMINHVHISEPGLKPIECREIHKKLADILTEEGYSGFVSIEMGTQENISVLECAMEYVAEIFGA